MPPNHRRESRARGFTLAETAISILLVGGVLVAALETVGASTVGRQNMSDRSRGQLLALQLMTEILRQDYLEPVDAPTFGMETGEFGGDRLNYDDVDDYDAWVSFPPENKDGMPQVGFDGWTRSVSVNYVNPHVLTMSVGADLGVKRITVTVTHDGKTVASLTAVRTNAQ